jgi:hypothetical protein
VFKKVIQGKYYYLASTSPIYNVQSKQGYKISLSIDEQIANYENKYQLNITLETVKE